ncbi:MAG: flavin reductase family protein [Spirochaetaceae bacterium]|nr:MAG: flavin reductase family protein [Spirochaetaceae bacterium]
MKAAEFTDIDIMRQCIQRLGDGGVFLVSGTQANPMTIGWGVIGRVWGRPVFQVLVRPSRHSFSLVEALGEFTVCIPDANHKQALALCGSRSGRELNKIEACGLSVSRSAHVGVPFITECVAHYECRVIHVNDVVNAALDPQIVADSYPAGDFHRVYFGEILGVYRH